MSSEIMFTLQVKTAIKEITRLDAVVHNPVIVYGSPDLAAVERFKMIRLIVATLVIYNNITTPEQRGETGCKE